VQREDEVGKCFDLKKKKEEGTKANTNTQRKRQ
jgi:hypothetical protein